jgi:hypothetical protein
MSAAISARRPTELGASHRRRPGPRARRRRGDVGCARRARSKLAGIDQDLERADRHRGDVGRDQRPDRVRGEPPTSTAAAVLTAAITRSAASAVGGERRGTGGEFEHQVRSSGAAPAVSAVPAGSDLITARYKCQLT